MHPITKILLPLAACALLAACTTVKAPLVNKADIVPAELLQCEGKPPRPSAGATDQQLDAWTTRLWFAHTDCQDKLGRVRGLLTK